jgi:hypothetical protein
VPWETGTFWRSLRPELEATPTRLAQRLACSINQSLFAISMQVKSAQDLRDTLERKASRYNGPLGPVSALILGMIDAQNLKHEAVE